jgi:hypothetical protein
MRCSQSRYDVSVWCAWNRRLRDGTRPPLQARAAAIMKEMLTPAMAGRVREHMAEMH